LEFQKQEEAKKDEVLLWNTFINTRIASQENQVFQCQPVRSAGANTYRNKNIVLYEEGK